MGGAVATMVWWVMGQLKDPREVDAGATAAERGGGSWAFARLSSVRLSMCTKERRDQRRWVRWQEASSAGPRADRASR